MNIKTISASLLIIGGIIMGIMNNHIAILVILLGVFVATIDA